jgi:bacterioferritin-associated ferredoxin
MIVCSCNVISDQDVRSTLHHAAKARPRTTGQVYGCLGCSAQCGRCARTIRKIMDDALVDARDDALAGCGPGCKCHGDGSHHT